MTETLDVNNGNAQRPTFLTVLCILSFIASGIGIIVMFLALGAKGVADANDLSLENGIDTSYMDASQVEALESAQAVFSWPYMIIALILILVGLFGVIKMWKLQKQGFYIYTGAQIVGLIVPLIFGMAFSAVGAIIPILFIVLYGLNLKHMS